MATSRLLPLLSLSLLFIFGAEALLQTAPSNITTGFVRFSNATRQVSWFYTPGGLVAYDGDVIFGTVAEFNRALVNYTYTADPETPRSNTSEPETPRSNTSEPERPRSKRRSYPPSHGSVAKRSNSVFPASSNLWPGGKVYYRYFDSNAESQLAQYVDGAIKAWTDAVPCLSFNKLANDNDPNGSNGIITIQAHNPNVGYCLASQIGYGTNSLWMELDTGGACGVPEVIHEWGHLIGLIHEQKRPDASQYDPFICSNLIDYPFNFPTTAEADSQCCGLAPSYGCCGWACQFTAHFGDYNFQSDPENGGKFDLNSIMLYRNDAFAKAGTFTLTGGPNDHNNPQSLSPADILRVRELYGCLPPSQPQCPNVGCNPNSGANTCSWPTAQDCIYPSLSVANPRAACACRAGYKATKPGIADTDTTKQWRLPADEGNFRVWVAQGVECDTLCDVSNGVFSCREVVELPADCLHN